MGLALSGAGHGTAFFGYLVCAPVPLGFIIWPSIGFLLPWSYKRYVAFLVLILMAINYCGVIYEALNVEQEYLVKTIKALPLVVTFVVGSYFIVQVLIAFYLIRLLREQMHAA